MSVGNLFVGSGSGKVGNLVLANTKSGQVTRVYQPKVHNPRTYAQMLQRAKFADAVKFFKQATKGFFKFAFEDKAQNESDYNAFMRHNIKNGIPMSKELYEDISVPALGDDWIMSDGRLTSPGTVSLVDASTSGSTQIKSAITVTFGSTFTGTTVGAISAALVADGFEEGDILTIVRIGSDVDEINIQDSASVASYRKSPVWTIIQIVLDSTSVLSLSDVPAIGYGSSNGKIALTANTSSDGVTATFESGASSWGAAIITRKLDSGLLASHSMLVSSPMATKVENYLLGQAVIDASLKSWGATGSVILKGSVAGLK